MTGIDGNENIAVKASKSKVNIDKSITINNCRESPPCHLPSRIDKYVANEEYIQKITNNLQPTKIITIYGIGGIGKSALVSEVIWRLEKDENDLPILFPDGIFIHEFKEEPYIDSVLKNIAQTFEVNIDNLLVSTRNALSNKKILLLLENVELADNLKRLLDIRGQCTVLMTTRSRKDNQQDLFTLQTLEPEYSTQLLYQLIGDYRIDKEIIDNICEIVGHLPFAINLIGKHLVDQSENILDFLKNLESDLLNTLNDYGNNKECDNIFLLLQSNIGHINKSSRKILAVIGQLDFLPFEKKFIKESLGLTTSETEKAFRQLKNYNLIRSQDKAGTFIISHKLLYIYIKQYVKPDVSNKFIPKIISFIKN